MIRRIGLLGGTFDPIHLGHLTAAEWARETGQLAEVWFIPAYSPPHKSGAQGASPTERQEMVRLAIQDHPAFRLETAELDRGGKSYAADTVELLTEKHPDAEFVWIIGGDMVQYLPQWHRIDDIVRRIEFLGLTRPGFPAEKLALPDHLRSRVFFAEMPGLDISSTEIRARLKQKLSVRYIVPEQVRLFVEEKGLYAT